MTPREYGYKMPPEWYRHHGTILTYPHNPETFFDRLPQAQDTFIEFVKLLSLEEKVYINVNNESMKEEVEKKLLQKCVRGEVHINIIPTDDSWCRDYAPTFIKNDNLVAVLWKFNGWGEKYPYKKDAEAGKKIAKALNVKTFSPDIILEGGAIEVSSQGVLLTTESCLLKRNPDKSKKEIEEILIEYLGINEVIWLPGGDIAGDDTDGHIDNIARFLNDSTVGVLYTDDKNDENFYTLQENLKFLEKLNRFEIVKISQPPPIYYSYPDGEMRLPASYLNFYISNFAVIVPTFGFKQDEEAISVLKKFFKDRTVIGLDANAIIVGQGAFHCLTQQIPEY